MGNSAKIVVLGGGRVGSAIARDLAVDHSVTVADRDAKLLQQLKSLAKLETVEADLSNSDTIQKLVANSDLVVGAVPGWMGFRTVEAAIEAGKNVVDISFFEEDPFRLDELAKSKGVVAVVDCGVAPGLSNLVLGRAMIDFDSVERFVCYVGGLPQNPQEPWKYKAPYSPVDVIEMYTRPARLRRGGEVVTMPALTETETLQFKDVGPLEAFNTDGLRTLLFTCDVPDQAEKTLRYAGHRDQIALLEAGGFFGTEEQQVGTKHMRPIDLSSKLLTEQWHMGPTDYDVTVMRLVVEGQRNGKPSKRIFDICDYFDREQGISSMARTTGYPCASVARMVLRGEYSQVGISPPEYLGRTPGCFETIESDLKARGVMLELQES